MLTNSTYLPNCVDVCVCARAHTPQLTGGATYRPESNLQKSILSCQPCASQGIKLNSSGLAANVLPAGPPPRPMGRWFMRHPDTCSFPGSVTTFPRGVSAHCRWLNEELMTDLVTELQGGLQLSFHKAWIPAQGYSPSTVSFMQIFSSERSLGSIT